MTELTDTNFKEETSTGKVVIDCWANWCGVCKMMKPKYEEFSKQHPNLKCCTLDVDKAPKLAQELNVSRLPSIIIYENGTETIRGGFELLETICEQL